MAITPVQATHPYRLMLEKQTRQHQPLPEWERQYFSKAMLHNYLTASDMLPDVSGPWPLDAVRFERYEYNSEETPWPKLGERLRNSADKILIVTFGSLLNPADAQGRFPDGAPATAAIAAGIKRLYGDLPYEPMQPNESSHGLPPLSREKGCQRLTSQVTKDRADRIAVVVYELDSFARIAALSAKERFYDMVEVPVRRIVDGKVSSVVETAFAFTAPGTLNPKRAEWAEKHKPLLPHMVYTYFSWSGAYSFGGPAFAKLFLETTSLDDGTPLVEWLKKEAGVNDADSSPEQLLDDIRQIERVRHSL